MKWVGWVVFVFSLMACFAISASNKQKLVELQAAAEKKVDAEKVEIQKLLDSQSGRNTKFEDQLKDEEAKVPPLQKELDELQVAHKETEAKIETLRESIADLKGQIADVKTRATNNKGTDQKAEKLIASEQEKIKTYKRHLPKVLVK